MKLEVVIPGEPHAQGRGRIVRPKGKAYPAIMDPVKSRSWKGVAQVHMQEGLARVRRLQPLLGPLRVSVLAVFSCPRSEYRKKKPRRRRWHMKPRDCDNIAKAVLDAGNGLLWYDDREVSQVTVTKVIGAQGEAPHTLLVIEPIEGDPL